MKTFKNLVIEATKLKERYPTLTSWECFDLALRMPDLLSNENLDILERVSMPKEPRKRKKII